MMNKLTKAMNEKRKLLMKMYDTGEIDILKENKEDVCDDHILYIRDINEFADMIKSDPKLLKKLKDILKIETFK